jgi:hypothetical protein
MVRALFLAGCFGLGACSSSSGAPLAAGADDTGTDASGDAPARPSSVTFGAAARFTIADGQGDHLAFPSVARLPDGSLMVVYRRGASHVDPTGRIMKQLGSADAKTWSTPEVLVDGPDDDRDPSLLVTAAGKAIVSWFPYRTVSIGASTLSVHHVAIVRSDDAGKSFGAPIDVTKDPVTTGASLDASGHWIDASGAPIVVEATSSPMREIGGALVLPTYGGPALNLSALGAATRSRISLQQSVDGGATWKARLVNPAAATDLWLQEPALISLGARALLFARSAQGTSPSNAGKLLEAISDDGGATFGDWLPLPFVGHAPDVVRLSSGALVVGVRELDDALTKEWISIVASVDDGATWSAPFRILNCQAVECGYPSLLELSPDELLVVYYAPGGASISAARVPVTTTF